MDTTLRLKAKDWGITRIVTQLREVGRGCLAGLHLLVEKYSHYEWKLPGRDLETNILTSSRYHPTVVSGRCLPIAGIHQEAECKDYRYSPSDPRAHRRAENCVNLKAHMEFATMPAKLSEIAQKASYKEHTGNLSRNHQSLLGFFSF